ncbi:asparaginase [hydrothermal vent metagenome]|uniref:Asparaginase n=1 Tax=hydrothermal vent metagenome TaxID=652676 RepID=A0A1W1D2T6_9ZZZZ
MFILNTGGTFNKQYNAKNGLLEVPFHNNVVEKILKSYLDSYDLAGAIYKDSLEMDLNDRKMLANIILESKDDTFIVIHGTDTMKESAEFVDTIVEDKKIIFVGAMQPFSIDPIEASLNLGLAIGFAKALEKNGTYICMNGYIKPWNQIEKNQQEGKFELV